MKANCFGQSRPIERKRCFWLRLSTCSILLATVVFGCSTQSAWKGRPISAWVEELNSSDTEKAAAAETALRRIGTNAIPYLLTSLTSAETSVAEWLETGGRTERRRTGAVLAFRVLGNSAVDALPALGVLLTNRMAVTNIGIAYAVAQSMAGIGEAAKPQLVASLNHPSVNVRRASLVALIDLGNEASDAMPSVLDRLKDPDAEVRGLALFFVSELTDQRDLKLRVFREASTDVDLQVRSFARKELEKMDAD